MSILRALAETESEFGGKQTAAQLFYRAKRLTLALDRLVAALNANGGAPMKIDNELKALRDDVKTQDVFNAARFAEHLRSFRGKL
jgi:hypothetical protein